MWVNDCLASLEGYTRYPTHVLSTYGYELGKIKKAAEMGLDEFVFLQDSCIVKDHALLDEMFDFDGSVALGAWPFFMYLGKYRLDTLKKVELPEVNNKHDSVHYEGKWTRDYAEAESKLKHICRDLVDTNVFEERHGRKNMVLENDYLIKYKGTWDVRMIENNA